ncbi:DUF4124 domain-containing protein [Arenimonas daejeonensis]|uniref:DUF4124 domain-containing protein n=1 Tax=Arenimonas daejeonensis TaxID=370777 RepID=UPI00131598EE|nr:DUF4124 domain-containing protein [Arenimonas daejeonensis]
MLIAVGPAAADDITVYRCKGGNGQVTVQDSPCGSGQTEVSRSSMTRPQDPPPKPAAPPPQPPDDEPLPAPDYASSVLLRPPPLYQCTDYDGDVRYSEDYDPANRCVPLAVLGYGLTGPQAATACRWVQESCLEMDDASACVQFKAKLKQARSDALHAFSDTAAFRKSEVQRLERIVNDSCR